MLLIIMIFISAFLFLLLKDKKFENESDQTYLSKNPSAPNAKVINKMSQDIKDINSLITMDVKDISSGLIQNAVAVFCFYKNVTPQLLNHSALVKYINFSYGIELDFARIENILKVIQSEEARVEQRKILGFPSGIPVYEEEFIHKICNKSFDGPLTEGSRLKMDIFQRTKLAMFIRQITNKLAMEFIGINKIAKNPL